MTPLNGIRFSTTHAFAWDGESERCWMLDLSEDGPRIEEIDPGDGNFLSKIGELLARLDGQ